MTRKTRAKKFFDGLTAVANQLITNRSAMANNKFSSRSRLSWAEMRAVYKTGIGNRIVGIKTRYALNDTIQFKSDTDEKFFNAVLHDVVVDASEKMMAFGRSVVVVFRKGEDLATPFEFDSTNPHPLQHRIFDAENVSVVGTVKDLQDDRYNLPEMYSVRGASIHWSRVVDFRYVTPPLQELPNYNFGGMSEYELIYPQLVNDAIVERATGSILEKCSTIFYKLSGFRDALRSGGDNEITAYFTNVEDLRSMYGAGIIDKEDDVVNVTQALTNVAETDQISLRRLAMVTGIPVSWLVGENVRGMNSSGDNERQILQDTVETIQRSYLLRPINELLKLHGKDVVEFKENQGETPRARVEYQTKAIDNAVKLDAIGEDSQAYLIEHGVVMPSKFEMFEQDLEDAEDDAITADELVEADETTGVTNEQENTA